MLSEYRLETSRVPVKSSYGDVFKAVRHVDSLPVAIKFNNDSSEENTIRFQRENDILHRLMPHPGIIEPVTRIISDIHDGKEKKFYVMHRADMNIEDWLYSGEAHLFNKKMDIFKQTCEALKHAHDKGFVHRDLHFRNVLLNVQPLEQVKLIDFGRAYDFNNPNPLSDTPAWGDFVMPPEVRIGAIEAPDSAQYVKSDVFALGLLWKLLLQEDTSPLYDMLAIINETKRYMATCSGARDIEGYYSMTTLEQRQQYYQDWIGSQSSQHEHYFEIPLTDVDLGVRVSNIARDLLNFDANKRTTTIDDVLMTVEGL